MGDTALRKQGIILKIMVALLLVLAFGFITRGWFKEPTPENPNEPFQIEFNAKDLESNIDSFLESRCENITLHIHFAADDTAVIEVGMEKEHLRKLLTLPEWIAASLPNALSLDIRVKPYLDNENLVQLQTVSFRVNGAEMPLVVGEVVSSGVAGKINEMLQKESIHVNYLEIEGGILKIETEKAPV